MTTLDNLRKAAKRWLKALREGDPEARARLARAHPGASDEPTLRDVQHALARERGYESWIALTGAVAAPAADESPLTRLLLAAGRGEAAEVAAVLDAHPGLVNTRGTLPGHTGLRTVLHFGCAHEAVVRLLLERGADPNIRDDGDNACPLHFVAERGDVAIARLLVEHGADPIGDGTVHQLDVLGWAVCFEGVFHREMAEYLLAHGAQHTLLSAVAMGDVDAIRRLIVAGSDPHQRMDRTNHRRTPLHLAVVKRQPAALAALLTLGADPNLTDAVGLTPLDHAALLGAAEMVAQLRGAGARPTVPAAIVLERPDELESLLQADPELLSTTDNRGWARLLVYASRHASGQVLETLLETVRRHRAGLSIVNMADDVETAVDGASGYTALHAAAFAGNREAVEVLLRHGADARRRDGKYGATPAGWAQYAGHGELAQRILEADVDLFDAIAFDRADRVAGILDRDPDAIDRPFEAYASPPRDAGSWLPAPECTPLEWARAQQKPNALRVLSDRGADRRTEADRARAGRVVDFLRAACWDEHVHGKGDHRMHDRAAQRLLAQDPALARASLYTAIVCGEVDEVARRLAANPAAARMRGGARGWTPLLYLAYTRFSHPPTIAHAVSVARLLLDAGANPNDFYMAGDSQYSVLTGVAGEGEQDAPRQPYAAELFALLLERGAHPFDVQVLYDTHFSGDMLWWLELAHRYSVNTPRGAAWQDPEWRMLDMGAYGTGARFVLEIAITKRKEALAVWALEHGANPDAAPARDPRFPKRSLYELALLEGLPEIAALLAQHGATVTAPALDPRERFLAACLRVDREEATRLARAHPELLQSPDPMFAAARRNHAEALALLIDLGVSPDIADATGKRPLHEAAYSGAVDALRLLIERGATVDARESTYGAAPIGWAAHADRVEAVRLLAQRSRDIWTLSLRGFTDRVREILAADPHLAREVTQEGYTPLWWLPDDEDAALAIAEALLAAGADPAVRHSDGETAAAWARRRGMNQLAARLERAAAGR